MAGSGVSAGLAGLARTSPPSASHSLTSAPTAQSWPGLGAEGSKGALRSSSRLSAASLTRAPCCHPTTTRSSSGKATPSWAARSWTVASQSTVIAHAAPAGRMWTSRTSEQRVHNPASSGQPSRILGCLSVGRHEGTCGPCDTSAVKKPSRMEALRSCSAAGRSPACQKASMAVAMQSAFGGRRPSAPPRIAASSSRIASHIGGLWAA
mmetsp:Transcript_15264/g.50138  ORF Transcript_15264/g.50138 Transcript_15264/m.50138 type:complete len:208 (-) Transcript_15264:2848-3471(-)